MIASRRGLGILVAIAALLAVLLVRELRHRAPGVIDRSLLPGIDLAHVTELRWERPPLPAVTLTPDHDRWIWSSAGAKALADGSVVRDALAAIRAGRWHREAAADAAGSVHGQLVITTPGGPRTVGFGTPLEGTEQAWVVIGERALLVDRWIVRALDVEPLALRIRYLFPEPGAASTVTLGTTRLEGHPRRMLSPRVLLVRPAPVAALEAALGQLEILRLSRPPAPGADDVVVDATPRIQLGETCPEDPALAWAATTVGDGCVSRESYEAVKRAVAAFEGPAESLIEPRLAPDDVQSITLADGVVLDLAKRAMVGDRPADPDRVTELLAVLAAPAEVAPLPATPSVQGRVTIVLRGGTTLVLELLGAGLVRRALEPLALRLTPTAYALLARTSSAFVDNALWSEEPTTITSIRIDGTTYTRGAVIGEWTRTPKGPVDAPRVEALVAALAVARGSSAVAAFSKRHDVTLTVTAPGAPPITHALAIDEPHEVGCVAQSGGVTLVLSTTACAAITDLAR